MFIMWEVWKKKHAQEIGLLVGWPHYFFENCKDDETWHFTMPGEHVLDFAAAIILRNDLMQAWGCLIFWNPWICTSISICSQSNCHNLTWASFWDPTWHLGEVHLFMLVTSQVSRTLIQRSTPLEGTFNPIAFQQEWGKKSNHMANMAYTPKNSHSNRRNDETRCWFCT